MTLEKELEKRKTFAIISHPDAGKTTITEKLLLYGGAINMAGTVKAKKSKKHATSDWMELEKQRGISVTSSVMAFSHNGYDLNLIDTPGHQDFSEDTYRTLTAVDSALMLIDAANGVETQTLKLFKVCRGRKTPIMTFINKMDRPGKDPFELLEELENVLGIKTYPVNWPIGSGDLFKGLFDRFTKEVTLYDAHSDRSQKLDGKKMSLEDPELKEVIGEEAYKSLLEDVELLDVAGDDFEKQDYLEGDLAPVFFGSALNSFGIETLLNNFTEYAPKPLARLTEERTVEPNESKFSAFIFKIQANMDPAHRDRVAFLRVCSGIFERGMKAFHVRLGRQMRLARPTQFMAQDRSLVEKAYPGDIVGIHDPGVFKIGDSLSLGESLHFIGLPVFAPEHFYVVVLKDALKSKQLKKALDQLSEEGAVQVFRPVNSNEQYLGVVGVLQIDVVKYRIQSEYGVEVTMGGLPYRAARWLACDDEKKLEQFVRTNSQAICLDAHKNPTLLLDHEWRLKLYEERNEEIEFLATAKIV